MKRIGVALLLLVIVAAVAVVVGLRTGLFRSLRPPAADAEVSAFPSTPPAPALPADTGGDWPAYHGGPELRGVADATFPDAVAVKWRVKTGAPVRQTPVVKDGRIFAVTARGDVIAVAADGTELWRAELRLPAEGNPEPLHMRIEAPPVAVKDLLVVGTDEGILLALDAATGAERWRLPLSGGVIRGAPNYLPTLDRLFVIEQSGGALLCVNPADGAVVWRVEGVDRSDAAPSVSEKFVVYGSCAGALHVFSTEKGEKLRDIKIEGDGQVAGGAAMEGALVWAGARGGMVVHANVETGGILWMNEDMESEVFGTPAVAADRVVAVSNDGFLYAVDRAAGTLLWKHDTLGFPLSPVIAGDRVLCAADGTLLLVALADGKVLWSQELSDEITGPAVTRGGIYLGTEDGALVALGPAPTAEGGGNGP